MGVKRKIKAKIPLDRLKRTQPRRQTVKRTDK